MLPGTPITTWSYPLFPHTTLFRSPPVRVKDGDYYDNVQSLIETSVASLEHTVPAIRSATYVPGQRAFADGQGRPLSDDALGAWVSEGTARTPGVSRSTLKRGILLNTLLRGQSGPGSELLAQVLRGKQPYVGPDARLANIFHSRTAGAPDAVRNRIVAEGHARIGSDDESGTDRKNTRLNSSH